MTADSPVPPIHDLPIHDIVERIAASHQRLLAAIAPLDDAQMQAPVLAGGWSVKDVLAHLAFWDQRLLHAIDPEGGPGVSRRIQPVVADIPFDDAWLEAVNGRIYRLNRDRPLAAVRAEFDSTRRRLLGVVATLTPHAVYDADGLTDGLGEPFAPMLLGAYEHYAEHADALAAQRW